MFVRVSMIGKQFAEPLLILQGPPPTNRNFGFGSCIDMNCTYFKSTFLVNFVNLQYIGEFMFSSYFIPFTFDIQIMTSNFPIPKSTLPHIARSGDFNSGNTAF